MRTAKISISPCGLAFLLSICLSLGALSSCRGDNRTDENLSQKNRLATRSDSFCKDNFDRNAASAEKTGALVSFSQDIAPIFAISLLPHAAPCMVCHTTGAREETGGLALDGNPQEIYDQIISPNEATKDLSADNSVSSFIINCAIPEESALVLSPSIGTDPARFPHPPKGKNFRGEADPFVQRIILWIKQGAQNN